MMKTVMMMLAAVSIARAEPDLEAHRSRVILLLDFRKAYDTVTRDFLFHVLEEYGFATPFIHMIRKLHESTTAKFLVNGSLSHPVEITSGIRQGCPLAPLLFILAAEVLSLAITQAGDIQGIEVPGTHGERHIFSAFVDDSTVFLQEASSLPRVLDIVAAFGRLSGLTVQPTKSQVIFLNTAVALPDYEGIPVLPHGATTRYLGHQVGTGALGDANWAIRIRNVRRRLANATRVATSVSLRVLILNVAMIPGILFT